MVGAYLAFGLPGWVIIRGWALINFLGVQSGCLFKVGR